ncbi:MAG: hypothetical protein NVS4B11_00880 [Ktedonobacteraceae bacterium]
MAQQRLLLPFTYGVDGKAIDHALLFAKASDSVLVALALIPVLQRPEAVRPERIQQAQDFLEMIRAKASSHNVSLEQHEIFANNILESIMASVQTMNCQGILLLFDEKEVKFLQRNEASAVRQFTSCTLYILHMLTKKSNKITPRASL